MATGGSEVKQRDTGRKGEDAEGRTRVRYARRDEDTRSCMRDKSNCSFKPPLLNVQAQGW